MDNANTFYTYLSNRPDERDVVLASHFDGTDPRERTAQVYARYVATVDRPQSYTEAIQGVEEMAELWGDWAFHGWHHIARPKEQWGM